MIKNEWKSLFKNKIIIIVLIAIIAIPTIYTTLFLGSMWDPYGKVSNLPVAVVNEDEPVIYNDKTLSIGEDLVENLKEDDSLAFNFVDSETALRGLENGTYYMVITIPEDFSAKAATVLDDNPQKMELQYATNPGTNYIASKMSETALTKLKESVAEKVTEVYTQSVFDSIVEIGDGMQEAADGSHELKDGISEALEGVNSYTDGVAKVADGLETLAENNDALNQGVIDLSSGVTALRDGSSQLKDGLSQMSKSIGDTLPKEKDINALVSGLDSYMTGLNQLNTAVSGLSVSGGTSEITNSLTDIGTHTQSAAASVQSIASAINVLSTANLNKAQLEALQTIGVAAKSLGSDLSTIGTQTQSVATNLTTMSAGLSKLNDLKTAVKTLNDNAELVLGGSKTAVSGLYSGLKTVKSTLDKTVIPGATTLNSGLVEATNGISGKKGLKESVKAYTDGVDEIREGVITLNEKSAELLDGMKKLEDGGAELSESLSDGANEVKDTTLTEESKEMFASPIEEKGTQITTVENNGHAMAAYMLSVALWVGCIALSIMYPLTEYEGELKSGLSWWASKASVVSIVAILQAIVMLFMLKSINGFKPEDFGRTMLVSCMASLAFMAIIYFFNACLGKVGSFLMLIFMVVQLAGSAGTYPIELSDSFVGKIHKYLPFSYTVDAFRKTIAGSGSISQAMTILVVLLVVFTILSILVFQIRAKKIKNGKPLLAEIIPLEMTYNKE